MRRPALPLAAVTLAFVSSFACGSSRNQQNYEGAAVALGFGIAAAGVHRAATGGCWAQCTHGLVCDEESGQCVPYESMKKQRKAPAPRLASDAGAATSDAEADGDTSDADDAGRAAADGLEASMRIQRQ